MEKNFFFLFTLAPRIETPHGIHLRDDILFTTRTRARIEFQRRRNRKVQNQVERKNENHVRVE